MLVLALNIVIVIIGLGSAIIASNKAVTAATGLARSLGVPAFVLGITVMSVGTDLPEIATSISSHIQHQADISIGDSTGSILAQFTIVLAALAFAARGMRTPRQQILLVGLATLPGLAATALLLRDGWFSRTDAMILIAIWLTIVIILYKRNPSEAPAPYSPPAPTPTDTKPQRRNRTNAGILLTALVVVGIGATAAVYSLVQLAQEVGVPEFYLAFFGAGLATSAPELIVVISCAVQGARQIALGDVLGSSFVDSTLSLAAGALIVPAAVTAQLALEGITIAAAAALIATTTLAIRQRLDHTTATILILTYAAAYAAVAVT